MKIIKIGVGPQKTLYLYFLFPFYFCFLIFRIQLVLVTRLIKNVAGEETLLFFYLSNDLLFY